MNSYRMPVGSCHKGNQPLKFAAAWRGGQPEEIAESQMESVNQNFIRLPRVMLVVKEIKDGYEKVAPPNNLSLGDGALGSGVFVGGTIFL